MAGSRKKLTGLFYTDLDGKEKPVRFNQVPLHFGTQSLAKKAMQQKNGYVNIVRDWVYGVDLRSGEWDRIKFHIKDVEPDPTIPVVWGISITGKLLDKGKSQLDYENCGYEYSE